MARIHHQKRLMSLKIVYYGPGLGGKTTNLVRLHCDYPSDERGELVKLDTDTERTLFFDYFPANLGQIAGYSLKADFFTVPGQSFYNATRRIVLEGADGVVFVADSAPDREEANLVTLENLEENLVSMGRTLQSIPHVFQWNKRDAPRATPVAAMRKQLNRYGAVDIPAVASAGEGVWETQAAILDSVLKDLRERSQSERRAHA